MAVKYKRRNRRGGRDFEWGTYDNVDVIQDFITKDREYRHEPVPLEVRLERLQKLVALVADASGIALASLIDSAHLDHTYVIDNTPDSD